MKDILLHKEDIKPILSDHIKGKKNLIEALKELNLSELKDINFKDIKEFVFTSKSNLKIIFHDIDSK